MVFQSKVAECSTGEGAGIRSGIANQEVIEHTANGSHITRKDHIVAEIDAPHISGAADQAAGAVIYATKGGYQLFEWYSPCHPR